MRWKGKTLLQFVPDEPVTKEVNAFGLFSFFQLNNLQESVHI